MTVSVIQIMGLKCPCSIGVYPWEKKIRQTVIMDIELELDIREACIHDDLSKTVDYTLVEQTILEFTASRHFQLLESLTDQLVHLLHEHFKQFKKVQIKAIKPFALSHAAGVAVTSGVES